MQRPLLVSVQRSNSVTDAECLKYFHKAPCSSDLMDLGPDPSIYIQYFERHDFAFQYVIEDNLQKAGGELGPDEIGHLFKPFLKLEIRRIIETFDRSRSSRLQVPCNFEKLVHGRRLYYLRSGRIHSGELGLRHRKLKTKRGQN